ncbi:MAG: hypothetical protein CR996_00645 [Draconibacterium sp.]|nr:MAG: hypothetical protein CR996_00645 [Draconibacterium sp.]PIF06726.1 MAG: hypothetical protein CSA36_00150 [Draconibacterium sp.]
MYRLILLLLILLITLVEPAWSQADGDRNAMNFEPGPFTSLYLKGGYKVTLKQGKKFEITAKARSHDIFDDLVVENQNGHVYITTNRDLFHYEGVALYITFPDLNELNIEGGVNLNTFGYLKLSDFSMYVNGGAKIDLEVTAENIDIEGEGGFLFDLKGVTSNLSVRISGAGTVDADELKAQVVDFTIEGFGTGSVHALETLNATIHGVGKIRYKGNPQLTKNIDGLGVLKRE